MKWQTPKTDWQIRYDENGRYAGDYFEAEDYQRIAGNIEYLRQMARELYTLCLLYTSQRRRYTPAPPFRIAEWAGAWLRCSCLIPRCV